MSFSPTDSSQNGILRNSDPLCTMAEIEEFDFSKALDRPRTLNIERQRSCDIERSLSELSIGISPRQMSRNGDSFSRLTDHTDNAISPLQKTGINTPRSLILDPHPILTEGWEALRRSLVYFRGQPVGTIAALDNSDEKLNYDQVTSSCHILWFGGEGGVLHNFITHLNFAYTFKPGFFFITTFYGSISVLLVI